MGKVTLKAIAEELNKVMSYGIGKNGEIIDKNEMIDVDMRDKPLEAEIIKRCKDDGDLRESDKPDFSADVWAWFVDNGLVPGDEKKQNKKADKAKADNGRDRGRDSDSKDDDKKERDRGRDLDSRDDDKGRDRDDRSERGRDRDRGEDRSRDRDRDDRGRDREREDREPRSRAAKSESYVTAAYRIAQGCVKDKVKQADFVYEMFNGLKPLFEEAGVKDRKYMLERACHYTIEMHGKVNVGSAKDLFKDNEDLLEDKSRK